MTENKVSRQGRLMRQAIAALTRENLIGQKFKNGEIRKKIVEPAKYWKCPDCFTNTVVELPNCQAELLEFEEPNHEKVILQLHGGGYIGGMRHAYRSFAGLYNEVGKRYSVFTPDYRVAPEHVFPAALIDALDAYEWLLKNGYTEEQIIVAGDSAGGGLALALCLCLKDNGRKLPCGIVAMSPWTDMTASGPSYEENFEKDPLFGGTEDSMIYNREYSAGADVTNPYLSPLFGDYEGFPPMLIQVGSYEMLLSDSVLLAQKAKEAGVKVRLSVYEGMFHVFQMAPLTLPECKRAWVEIGHFIDEIDGGRVRGKQEETADEPDGGHARRNQEAQELAEDTDGGHLCGKPQDQQPGGDIDDVHVKEKHGEQENAGQQKETYSSDGILTGQKEQSQADRKYTQEYVDGLGKRVDREDVDHGHQ